jgi:predicted protein tyrosine phosphatase
MNVLFVCGRNRKRSPTAEELFSGVAGLETCSAGVSPDAEQPVTDDALEWADLILVMEPTHRAKLNRSHGRLLRGKRVGCLQIPDKFEFMDDQLVRLLWERLPRFVPELARLRPA